MEGSPAIHFLTAVSDESRIQIFTVLPYIFIYPPWHSPFTTLSFVYSFLPLGSQSIVSWLVQQEPHCVRSVSLTSLGAIWCPGSSFFLTSSSWCYLPRAHCPMCREPKIMARGFWEKERSFFIHGLTHKETGDASQIYLSNMGFGESFKGVEGAGWYVKVLTGQVWVRKLWNWNIYDKIWLEASALILLKWRMDHSLLKGFHCSGSGHVLVLWFCGGGVGGGEPLAADGARGQISLLCASFSCKSWGLGLLSLKSNSISC